MRAIRVTKQPFPHELVTQMNRQPFPKQSWRGSPMTTNEKMSQLVSKEQFKPIQRAVAAQWRFGLDPNV